jgi:hypothetical protein
MAHACQPLGDQYRIARPMVSQLIKTTVVSAVSMVPYAAGGVSVGGVTMVSINATVVPEILKHQRCCFGSWVK